VCIHEQGKPALPLVFVGIAREHPGKTTPGKARRSPGPLNLTEPNSNCPSLSGPGCNNSSWLGVPPVVHSAPIHEAISG
jgi:hypothetical protein